MFFNIKAYCYLWDVSNLTVSFFLVFLISFYGPGGGREILPGLINVFTVAKKRTLSKSENFPKPWPPPSELLSHGSLKVVKTFHPGGLGGPSPVVSVAGVF